MRQHFQPGSRMSTLICNKSNARMAMVTFPLLFTFAQRKGRFADLV